MANDRQQDAEFKRLIERAVSQLVHHEHFMTHSVIKMPVWLPSGSGVVIEVWPKRESVLVTDGGSTFTEAELLNADHQFSSYAPKIAEHSGVRYDKQALFIDRVSYDRIHGAVGTVCSCAKQVLDYAVLKRDEKKYRDDKEVLYNRLVRVFSKQYVSANYEIRGESSHPWHVAAYVKRSHFGTIFEPVSKHHSSIATAATKFHDIARLEDAPSRVSVVPSKKLLGDMVNVLAQASSVIEESVKDDTIKLLAEAA